MRISAWSSDVCSSDLRLVEAGIVDADGGLGGDAGQQALMPFEEAAGLRLSEEKAADHLPGPAEDGDRQIAFHGQTIGRASWRDSVCPCVWISVVAVALKTTSDKQEQHIDGKTQ